MFLLGEQVMCDELHLSGKGQQVLQTNYKERLRVA